MCTSPLYNGEPLKVACPRKHVAHAHCIRKWERACAEKGKYPTCPICRGINVIQSVDSYKQLNFSQCSDYMERLREEMRNSISQCERDSKRYRGTLADDDRLLEKSLETLVTPDLDYARRKYQMLVRVSEMRIARTRAQLDTPVGGPSEYGASYREELRIIIDEMENELAREDLRPEYRPIAIRRLNSMRSDLDANLQDHRGEEEDTEKAFRAIANNSRRQG